MCTCAGHNSLSCTNSAAAVEVERGGRDERDIANSCGASSNDNETQPTEYRPLSRQSHIPISCDYPRRARVDHNLVARPDHASVQGSPPPRLCHSLRHCHYDLPQCDGGKAMPMISCDLAGEENENEMIKNPAMKIATDLGV